MIQRIQSIYLLITTILGVLSCLFPLAVVGENPIGYTSWWPYAVLSTIIPLLAFGSIFLYHKRILQMRLNSLNIILLGFQISIAAVLIWLTRGEKDAFILLWPVVLPPIEIILSLLAIRAIGKDEVLVRTADRLR